MMVDAPIQINPQQIYGNWNGGWTLDEHTVSSLPTPDGGFDTVRTELGEMVFQLKYRENHSKVLEIAQITASFISERQATPYLNAIIPIPPSNTERQFQPVFEVAREIGKILKLPVPFDYLVKIKSTKELKDIEDPESRRALLQGAMQVIDQRFQGKYILLLDDLYRSGETLKAATDVLITQGKLKRVSVLTLTRTRTKK